MTLEDTKAYLRLDSTGEDAVVERLVASAAGVAEAYLGTALVRRSFLEAVPADGRWHRLRHAPVIAITAVTAPTHAIDIDAYGEGWVRASGPAPAQVTYQAGMAEAASEVPAPIAQGVVRLAAHLYEHRDDAGTPPAAVAALWRPYRRLRLGAEARA